MYLGHSYNEDRVTFWLCAGEHVGKVLLTTGDGDTLFEEGYLNERS